MTESARPGCDEQLKWHWYQIKDDLVKQGGLDSDVIFIDPASVKPHFCAGTFLDQVFTLTWVKDRFLLLSMPELSQALVDAFTAVVEYKPFASYLRDGYITVEWDKIDPEKRWADLQGERELIRLN